MTGAEIMAAVGFFVMLFGAIFAVWRYVDSKLTLIRSTVDVATLALQQHRLHVAEIYVTKAGLSEQTVQIMRAIEGVASRIDGLHDRLDRLYEPPRARRSST